jgi:ATP phosphoribosyltransferase regulatory subunit
LRESTQIGCELIGAKSVASDMEALAIICEVLDRLGLHGDYAITLNNVDIFNGVAEHLALDPSSRGQMRQLVDARNAVDLNRFLVPFASERDRGAFARMMQLSGKGDVLRQAHGAAANGRSAAALERLGSLWRIIESLGLADTFEVDLGDVSRLDYYTGLSFEIYVKGAGTRVGSGGRYDNLAAAFGKAEAAVGFVLNLDALAELLSTLNALSVPPVAATCHPVAGADPGELLSRARAARDRGERVVIEFNE